MFAPVGDRLDPKGPASGAVGLLLHLHLSVQPHAVARTGDLTALWLGPDEWLLVAPAGRRTAVGAPCRGIAGTSPSPSPTSPPSGPRSSSPAPAPAIRSPTAAPSTCTRGSSATAGARTTLGRAQVVLVARAPHRTGFWALVRSSYAGHPTDRLLDAATEYLHGTTTSSATP
ncbi:sarcosine oxidase subunit gamma family protein [Streptomyces sp. NPDC004822]